MAKLVVTTFVTLDGVMQAPGGPDEDDPIASGLNTLPKYVASRSREKADWHNSTVIRDVPTEVARLKEQPGDELQVHGSGNLIQTLIEHDLVDAYNVITFPVVLGTGKRLFPEGVTPGGLRLTENRTTSPGVVVSSYDRVGKPEYGAMGLDT